jgi:hypothetical protein
LVFSDRLLELSIIRQFPSGLNEELFSTRANEKIKEGRKEGKEKEKEEERQERF